MAKTANFEQSIDLYNSQICRLCGEPNGNGTSIISTLDDEDEFNIITMINRYLPLKVADDGKYPLWICPGCHLQVESTVQFFDLVVTGQANLRALYQQQMDAIGKTDAIDLSVKKEVDKEQSLYPPDHEICQLISGDVDKTKRKRGRPSKLTPDEMEIEQQFVDKINDAKMLAKQLANAFDSRKNKRQIRMPARFQEVVQGKELERIYIEKGVIDRADECQYGDQNIIEDSDEVIGHLRNKNGSLLGDLLVKDSQFYSRRGFKLRNTHFVCDVCNRIFTHSLRFMEHLSTHQNVRFECTQCLVHFQDRIDLFEHQSFTEHTGEGIIEHLDDELEQSSVTVNNNKNGNIASNPSATASVYNPVQGIVPNKDTNNGNVTIDNPNLLTKFNLKIKDDMKSKIKYKNSKLKIQSIEIIRNDCKICNKSFVSSSLLSKHMDLVHVLSEKVTKSSVIPVPSLEHLHIKLEKQFSCDMCSRKFKTTNGLIFHKDADHHNLYVCSKCNKTFRQKQLLQRHQMVHTGERPYACTICAASFKSKSNLHNHMPVHSDEKKYKCEQCDQSFSHKTSLTLHHRWHTGLKPFSCEHCEKKFTQNGNLQEHMRIHTGERPFKCVQCGKNFKTNSQWRIHSKRHSNYRPYECHICLKTFLHYDIYKTHLRRHNNEKPFACSFCPKSFSEQWALRKHTRVHTGEKPYSCTVCNKTFADCSNLTKHKKIHVNAVKLNEKLTVANEKSTAQTKPGKSESVLNITTTDNIDLGNIVSASAVEDVIYITYQDPINNTSAVIDTIKPYKIFDEPLDFNIDDSKCTQSSNQISVLPDSLFKDTDIKDSLADNITSTTFIDNDYLSIGSNNSIIGAGLPTECSTFHEVNNMSSQYNNDSKLSKMLIDLYTGNPDLNDEMFDSDGRTVEMFTSDGKKLRLLSSSTDPIDLSSEYISII